MIGIILSKRKGGIYIYKYTDIFTEFPNTILAECLAAQDHDVKRKPAAAKKRPAAVMKRPAGAKKRPAAALEEEDEEEEEEDNSIWPTTIECLHSMLECLRDNDFM